jgi:DNA (cytosine-5)-methyltransferase 1
VKIIEPVIAWGGLQEHQTPRTDGISPSLTAAMGMGGGQTPMIVTSRGRNPQNPSDRTPGADTQQRLEPNSEGICNTLTSVQKDNLVLEPRLVGGIGEKNWGKQWRQGDRVYDSEAVAMAITAQPLGNTGGNSYLYSVKTESNYRIRKLTPLECWRLMGFTDEDFHKAEKVNSNTQLYKQAGNSIVKSVLMAIFKQMLNPQ